MPRSRREQSATHPDPCPDLIVERGPEDEGVGSWVPQEKHRLLQNYLSASRHAWARFPRRVFIDPFCGPGRIQVRGESFTRDGGAVVAWRQLANVAPFTEVFTGDIDDERALACKRRLKAIGAPVVKFSGPALETVKPMVSRVPSGALCMAYIDPYNLEFLSFEIIRELASLPKIDLAVHFSTMDLHRNVDFELDPGRARFDDAAPGWRDIPVIKKASKASLPATFFGYWCDLVKSLGFEHSREMPLVRNEQGKVLYRLVFFAKHPFPQRIWNDVARSPQKDMFG